MLARHGQRSNGALLAAPRSRYTVCAYRACGHPLRHPWSPLWLCNTVSLELAPTEPSFGQSPNKRCRLRARLNLLLQRPRVPGWVACARCTGRLQAARRRTRATATVATTAATPSPSSTGIESGAAPASAVRARVAGAAFVAVEAPCQQASARSTASGHSHWTPPPLRSPPCATHYTHLPLLTNPWHPKNVPGILDARVQSLCHHVGRCHPRHPLLTKVARPCQLQSPHRHHPSATGHCSQLDLPR